MPQITSTDALIERVNEAYPDRPWMPACVVDAIERGYPAAAYDTLINGGLSRTYEHTVSHDKILECVDDNGNAIPEKFSELIKTVRSQIQDAELESIRRQLEDDFKESYEFTWIPDL